MHALIKQFHFIPGVETHTFTAIGRCHRTGRMGIAVSTGELAVGSRVPFVKPNIGVVATQALTDPRLGTLAIQLLDLGYPAHRIMTDLESADPYIDRRQLGIIDRWGHTAVRTGAHNAAWAGHLTGNGWIVMANAVVGEHVAKSMASAMEESVNADLEVRLMNALDAGTRAGGQPDGQRSAALLVYENEGYGIMNLRVDDDTDPMAALWRVFNKMQPLMPYYKERPDNPEIGRVYDWAQARGIDF
jgi:uncharacterized Ntn-hydrolase superfamily protein